MTFCTRAVRSKQWIVVILMLAVGMTITSLASAADDREQQIRRRIAYLEDRILWLRDQILRLDRQIEQINAELGFLSQQLTLARQAVEPLQFDLQIATNNRNELKQAESELSRQVRVGQLAVNKVKNQLTAELDSNPHVIEARQKHEQAQQRAELVRSTLIAALELDPKYVEASEVYALAQQRMREINANADTPSEQRIAAATKMVELETPVRRMEQAMFNADPQYVQLLAEVEQARKAMQFVRGELERAIPTHPEYVIAAQSLTQTLDQHGATQERLAAAQSYFDRVRQQYNQAVAQVNNFMHLIQLKLKVLRQHENLLARSKGELGSAERELQRLYRELAQLP